MKRYIKNSFDPETNPTDAARSTIDMLNSDLTALHNVVKKYANLVKQHPDDNSMMNKVVDDLSSMQLAIDEICDKYLERGN